MQMISTAARHGAAILMGLALVTATAMAWYPIATQAELGTVTS